MKRTVIHFLMAAALCLGWNAFASRFFVYPPEMSLWSFLPPILAFMWGPAGIAGSVLGGFIIGLAGSSDIFNALFFACGNFLGSFLPYKLWHFFGTSHKEVVFSFYRKSLWKFVSVIFITATLTSLFFFFIASISDSPFLPFSSAGWNLTLWDWCFLRLLNDFTVAIFFGLPLFFILVIYGYPFYLPSSLQDTPTPKNYDLNPLMIIFLYAFFLGIFVLLDVSGIVFDIDRLDNWVQFVSEVLVVMDVTIFALMYVLMKYRKSVMTHLIIMELPTIFVTALLLGSIDFITLDGIIDAHVKNDLEKISVIYRERLAHTFSETIATTRSLSELAADGFGDLAKLQNDALYRKNYLTAMEKNFQPIVKNSPGCIGFYLILAKDFGGDGFIWTRNPKRWGTKLPPFSTDNLSCYNDRCHLLRERYLAALSEPYMCSANEKHMVSYVMPLREKDRFIGLVGLDVDFNYIIHEIQRMSVYANGLVCLLDKHGRIIYSSQPNGEEYLAQKGIYSTEVYLSSGVWLKIAAFSHDIYADRNNMLLHFVSMVLCVVIVISFFNIWLVKRGIRPLMIITEAARKIANGDLAVKLPKEPQNELGTLVKSIREMVEKLEIYVYRDKLTGLRNVASYTKKYEELEKEILSGTKNKYAVVLFDVNFLKRTNDTYGHDAGNELIRRTSSTICKIFAHSPVFRIGGDEFIAILENADYENREKLLKKFDEEIVKQSFDWEDTTIPVSVARGIGLYFAGEKYADVFKTADEEMYNHKASLKAMRTS